jgi:hypothetical protein
LDQKYTKIAHVWVVYQWSARGSRLGVISHNGIYILIFILQFLLLYTHSGGCGDVTRWCCGVMTRVSTNGEQAAKPEKKKRI